MASHCSRENVVLTGFGPFGVHKTNDSWDAVCLVAQGERGKKLEDELSARFVVEEMPVCYEFADQTVPRLWAEHNPLFVLHVGIHTDDIFRLETKSKKGRYDAFDVSGRCPPNNTCPAGTEEVMECSLDLRKLLEDVKATLSGGKISADVILSDDPGQYLCGYTYYTSLCANAGRTLFLHIPPPHSSVSLATKADVVEAVVVHSIRQIRSICN